MTDLVRLTYASMTTATSAGVQHDLIDILHHARHRNAKRHIHGVLFYDNNYFFQCLEGERQQVFQLYHKIAKDPRHSNIVQLTCNDIEAPVFKRWQMKYVLEDSRIRHFFANHYGQKFNPYLLAQGADASSPDLNQEFIQLLLTGQEALPDDTRASYADTKAISAPRLPIYSSRFFTLFVILPIIIICLLIYLN